MIDVTFCGGQQVEDSLLKFAVIAARFEDKWIFCRHRERSTWEIPGGHREDGETIDEAARRELWEETGALEAEIRPVSVYGVTRDGVTTYGKLYFATVAKMEKLSETSEIGEVRLFDAIPSDLTYPQIQPHLYNRTQGWLNFQTNADELWDVYDENRNLTGRLQRRGDMLEGGAYHLVVHVWTRNSKGEFLLTKRSPNKGFPLMWESTGGSALAGDDSLTAAVREVREETGVELDPGAGRCVITYRRDNYFCDVWLFRHEFDLSAVTLLEGETCGKMKADAATIRKMYEEGILVPYRYLDELLAIAAEEK